MSIQKSEKELFTEWEGKRKGFVKDGVVSERDYLQSTPKIVFILKEVNSKDAGWDLRKFVAKGGQPQTWRQHVWYIL